MTETKRGGFPSESRLFRVVYQSGLLRANHAAISPNSADATSPREEGTAPAAHLKNDLCAANVARLMDGIRPVFLAAFHRQRIG
ncbi:hypothetical protein [Sphingopyxis sp. 113P3]|uniref:hypothetical protein n=1 Tax=Sphingopyxis sp. (strain 113P3) TaxID=292913 RepID=UPI0006AD3C2F|nr:hypothetical protein [Sphingopyxis sp. 113P3]ALC12848.1 hypothetical protein LH20_12890 [Sphingopyxis sp. 113P3]